MGECLPAEYGDKPEPEYYVKKITDINLALDYYNKALIAWKEGTLRTNTFHMNINNTKEINKLKDIENSTNFVTWLHTEEFINSIKYNLI